MSTYQQEHIISDPGFGSDNDSQHHKTGKQQLSLKRKIHNF
jgi:hypothetical protein